MKKFLALTLIVAALAVCLVSCGGKPAIEISPYGKLPECYEITVVSRSCLSDGKVLEDEYIRGCDADGNVYVYDLNGKEWLYLSKNGAYDLYTVNETTKRFELEEENTDASDRYLDNVCGIAFEKRGYPYEKIDSLDLPAELSGKELVFLDSKRFEYYNITLDNGSLEVAVEKETGLCFYSLSEDGDLTYISKYTVPFEGNYADMVGADAE